MKTRSLHPACALAGFALIASLRAQTAWPTPVDTNTNGKIDSAEIQAVIDSVAAGSTIYLPANQSYNIDVPVTITKDNITLLGEGHGSSTTGGTVFKIVNNIEGLVISNCTGSGMRHCSVVAPTGHSTNAIRLEGATNAFLDDVRVTSAYNGIEIVNCTGPTITDTSLRAHVGAYGLKIWGNGGTTSNVQVTRITGAGASGNAVTEWMIVGPSVNGLTIQSSRFVGALRGMRLTGTPGPTSISTTRWGTDNQIGESVVAESGSGLTMVNSWIGQPDATAVVLGAGFGGNANLTNLRIRGAYGHGLQIDGGSTINLWNPLIGANGSDPNAPANTIANIQIATGVSNVRVVGGRVGPLYNQGTTAQYYGVHYLGSATQSDTNNVKTRGVSLAGNPVPYAPNNLPANN
jgi:hypothetical protein